MLISIVMLKNFSQPSPSSIGTKKIQPNCALAVVDGWLIRKELQIFRSEAGSTSLDEALDDENEIVYVYL